MASHSASFRSNQNLAESVQPCHFDRLPGAVLQDILHRAACRAETSDGGYRVLEENKPCFESWRKWAQVAELCRLQTVSKHFSQVASTVQNLQYRISPFSFKHDMSRLARFLGEAKCAKSIVITIRCQVADKDRITAAEYWGSDGSIESQLDIFEDNNETFEELFFHAPCLDQFAVVWDVSLAPSGDLDPDSEEAASFGAEPSNHMLKALAGYCPQLKSLALGIQHFEPNGYLHYPWLVADSSLASVSRPQFLQLKRLNIHGSAQDAQAVSTLISMCPALQQLMIYHWKPLPDVGGGPDCLRLESESLEVLDVVLSCTLLDIRTPNLYKLALKTESQAPIVMDTPNLSDLTIEGSVKVRALSSWKLERLLVRPNEEYYSCVWDCNGLLHEAVQSCLGLSCLIFDSEEAVRGSVSGLIQGLEELEDLRLDSIRMLEVCQSITEPVKLPQLKKLAVYFDADFGRRVNESHFEKVVQSVTVGRFPRLECLILKCSGYFTRRSANALLALRERRPMLKIIL